MSRLQLGLLYGTLLCVIAGTSVAFRSHSIKQESAEPLIDNAGPRGAKALFTWLTESGKAPRLLDQGYEKLPPDVKTVVALEPTRRVIDDDEWAAMQKWVKAGGTFVYAVPRKVRTQFLERELGLKWMIGPQARPLVSTDEIDEGVRSAMASRGARTDPYGADVQVLTPSRLMAGVKALRVAADDGIDTDLGKALPLAGADEAPALLEIPMEKGSVLILAGSDIAENRRLGLGDNLRFWANLAARGPMGFDEFHHHHEQLVGKGLAEVAGPALLQLLACAGALILARARRFGPARLLTNGRRRSQSEYVEQLARLYTSAQIDQELVEELYRSLRRGLFERLGVSATLDDHEVARRVRARAGLPEERYLSLVQALREALARGVTRKDFLALSQAFATFERDAGC